MWLVFLFGTVAEWWLHANKHYGCSNDSPQIHISVFPNNPFSSLLSTRFHLESLFVCSISLLRPPCLSLVSLSPLISVFPLSSHFLSIPLSLTGSHSLSTAMGVLSSCGLRVGSSHLLWDILQDPLAQCLKVDDASPLPLAAQKWS